MLFIVVSFGITVNGGEKMFNFCNLMLTIRPPEGGCRANSWNFVYIEYNSMDNLQQILVKQKSTSVTEV
jgi:hypothetical protein